jgi:hypothetical protein
MNVYIMENMLCKCEQCLQVYISDLHKQINKLQIENTTLKKMILQENCRSDLSPKTSPIHIIDIETDADTNITN